MITASGTASSAASMDAVFDQVVRLGPALGACFTLARMSGYPYRAFAPKEPGPLLHRLATFPLEPHGAEHATHAYVRRSFPMGGYAGMRHAAAAMYCMLAAATGAVPRWQM